MKLKNASNKIIGYGEAYILPGKTADIPDDICTGNKVIADFIKSGKLVKSNGAASKVKVKAEDGGDKGDNKNSGGDNKNDNKPDAKGKV